MLNWLYPGALWLSLSVLPIALFYFLRMRFRRQPVSSGYIWNRLIKENQKGSRLRFRSVLLLILQVVIALIVAAASAQPILSSIKPALPGMMFLLDASASMSDKDMTINGSMKSRWESAYLHLEEELKKLPGDTEVVLFLCSQNLEKIAGPTSNYKQVLNKVASYKPYGSEFRENDIVKNLEAWMSAQNRVWKACLISDGGLDLDGVNLANLFKGNLQYIPVGANGDDLGITGLRINPDGHCTFIVMNGYTSGKAAEIILEKEGHVLYRDSAVVQPGKSNFSFRLGEAEDSGVYTVIISNAGDNYPQDDSYSLVKRINNPVRVLLAGPDNSFLSAVLNHPGINLTHIKDFSYENSDPGSWDLVIADHVFIPTNWNGNMLCFNVIPPGVPLYFNVPVEGNVVPENSSHPLLRFADIRNWYVASGNSLKAGPNIQVLARVEDKPFIAAWETNGCHFTVIGTGLYESDIGLSPGFPVFLQNILKWCVPQYGNELAYTMTAGESIELKAGPGWKIKNNNKAVCNLYRNGSIITFQPYYSGVYEWQEGLNSGFIAANIPPGEMDLSPRVLQTSISGNKSDTRPVDRKEPFSVWLLLALLILLISEWFIWRGLSGLKSVRKV